MFSSITIASSTTKPTLSVNAISALERGHRHAPRAATVYGKIISDAHRAGALDPPGICPPPPQSFGPDAAALRASVMAKVPDDVAARAVAGWTALFGMVSFELFGQFENVITDRDAFFEHSMRCQGRLTGLSP